MRCIACGYDGIENVARGNCVKCGTKLQDAGAGSTCETPIQQIQDPQLKQTVVQTGDFGVGYSTPAQASDLKKTVVQGASGFQVDDLKATIAQGNANQWNGIASDAKEQEEMDDDDNNALGNHQHFSPVMVNGKLECPNCHYPLSSDSLTSCPNCMADFTGLDEEDEEEDENPIPSQVMKEATSNGKNAQVTETVNISKASSRSSNEGEYMIECDHCKKQISAEFKFCPYCATEVIQRTIAFRKKRTKVEKEDASIEKQPEMQQPETLNLQCHLSLVPDDDEDVEAITNHYEGNNVILNRANTDSNNPTITSKQQAELIYENGNWFIENRSEYGTTFIAVNRRFQLNPGDVVMLGDRRFIFGIDESK